jgi:hypothetical protein
LLTKCAYDSYYFVQPITLPVLLLQLGIVLILSINCRRSLTRHVKTSPISLLRPAPSRLRITASPNSTGLTEFILEGSLTIQSRPLILSLIQPRRSDFRLGRVQDFTSTSFKAIYVITSPSADSTLDSRFGQYERKLNT